MIIDGRLPRQAKVARVEYVYITMFGWQLKKRVVAYVCEMIRLLIVNSIRLFVIVDVKARALVCKCRFQQTGYPCGLCVLA